MSVYGVNLLDVRLHRHKVHLYGLKSSGAPKGTLSFFRDICSSLVLGANTLYSTYVCATS
jgi:hypothetical protein